jgi:hypothetical protein
MVFSHNLKRYVQKIILGISNICLRLFFRMPLRGVGPTGRRLDLERKSSLINRLITIAKEWSFEYDNNRIHPGP